MTDDTYRKSKTTVGTKYLKIMYLLNLLAIHLCLKYLYFAHIACRSIHHLHSSPSLSSPSLSIPATSFFSSPPNSSHLSLPLNVWQYQDPHLIQYAMGPQESPVQTRSISCQLFFFVQKFGRHFALTPPPPCNGDWDPRVMSVVPQGSSPQTFCQFLQGTGA